MDSTNNHLRFPNKGNPGGFSVGWFVAGGLVVLAFLAYAAFSVAQL